MDCFHLFLNGLYLAGQAVLHILFVSRLTEKRRRLWYFAAYMLLLSALELTSVRFALTGILPVCAGVLALYAVSRLGMGNPPAVSYLAAVLAFYISQFSFGIINSVEAALFPRFIGSPLLYPLLLTAQALFFVLCVLCYGAVGKLLPCIGDRQAPHMGLLLFPSMFSFAAELYILQRDYSFSVSASSLETVGKHGSLLLLQAMGLAALLCTLYAYRRLCQGLQAQAALQSLSDAAQRQKVYITEAQARYEQTKAFRHDIKNHLSVLDGLLRRGELGEGREYLKKLEAVSETLSFPYQTGNPVVDILLGEKLGLARGIEVEVSLSLPRPCGMDDFDLCVLFANALDNAIAACRSSDGDKMIRISAERQGDFCLLTFVNTCSDAPLPPAGTGLSNIRAVAEKYRGAVLSEQSGGLFRLSVLLNVSPPAA
ncbi:MAG: GHKL domain-containing protein [Oscillospiraceae bacterium]|jgi:hypothetical protein|nr:GHKL domain-containing protein [Oscillospiraceae bacterium]